MKNSTKLLFNSNTLTIGNSSLSQIFPSYTSSKPLSQPSSNPTKSETTSASNLDLSPPYTIIAQDLI